MDIESKQQQGANNPSNGINVEDMDLDEFAFDNVEDENLAEKIKNLNVDPEKPVVSINSNESELKLEKEKSMNSSSNMPEGPLDGTNADFIGKNVENFEQQLKGKQSKSMLQKDWHVSITPDLRNHSVVELVKAIFPSPYPYDIDDPRIRDLISYARKVENDFFEVAPDKEAYYQMLAEKVYKIQKELQEKKEKREKKQQKNASTLMNVGQQPELANSLAKENTKPTQMDSEPNRQQQQQDAWMNYFMQ